MNGDVMKDYILNDKEWNMLLESLDVYQDEVERLNKITTCKRIPLKPIEGLRKRILNTKYVVLKDEV